MRNTSLKHNIKTKILRSKSMPQPKENSIKIRSIVIASLIKSHNNPKDSLFF